MLNLLSEAVLLERTVMDKLPEAKRWRAAAQLRRYDVGMKMKEYLIFVFSIIFGLIFLPSVYSSDNDYVTRDPNASYDENYPDMNRVLEIPGYKLDPKSALAIPIKKEEYEFAKDIDPMISDKARRYVENRKLNFTDDFKLYAAKDLGNYILLYFQEGNTKDGHTVMISDGGFELIYSKELENIIGTFSAGYKG